MIVGVAGMSNRNVLVELAEQELDVLADDYIISA